jgi:hypothetical protein
MTCRVQGSKRVRRANQIVAQITWKTIAPLVRVLTIINRTFALSVSR